MTRSLCSATALCSALAALSSLPSLCAQQPSTPSIPTFRQPVGADPAADAADAAEEIHTRDLKAFAERWILSRTGGMRLGDGEERQRNAALLCDSLAGAARAFVEPPLAEGQDVRLVGGRFLVSVAAAEQQAWIDRFLARQPATSENLIELDLRLYLLDARARARLALDKDEPWTLDRDAGRKLATELERIAAAGDGGKPGDGGKRGDGGERGDGGKRGDGDGAGKARAARAGDGTAEELAAPRLSAYPLQPVSMSIVRQISYVRDFDVQVGDGGVMAEPVVDVLQDGFVFQGAAAWLGEGRIGLLGDVHVGNVLEPMPTKKIEVLPGAPKVEIQVPVVRTVDIATEIVVPDGGYAVFPGPLFEGRHALVVVRAAGSRR